MGGSEAKLVHGLEVDLKAYTGQRQIRYLMSFAQLVKRKDGRISSPFQISLWSRG
jgi:hypothetical protein